MELVQKVLLVDQDNALWHWLHAPGRPSPRGATKAR